ncbi:MAG: hypothetical protein QG578_631 [Thermodesulfobacteriota bacterium]|nr:hypothetical protein [Thermodesulfobacteriota bacterium]
MVINMHCNRILICILTVCLISSFFSTTYAGNKEMVDERIQEMDDQNKQMVKQIPGIPKDGKVDAKARVTSESGKINFEVYQVKSVAKEGALDFGGGNNKPEDEVTPRPAESTKEKSDSKVAK